MIEECLVVEFAVEGDDCPLAELTAETGARVESQPPLARRDGTSLLRFTVSERADAFVDALESDDRIDFLHVVNVEEGTNVRCLSKQPCVVHDLVDAGFLVESIEYRQGTGYFGGSVVGYDVLQDVLETTRDAIGINLQRVYQLDSNEDEYAVKKWDVTPAQEEALRTAFEMEYISVPREVTASDVADELGISKSAFLERLRRGEQQLLSQMFG
jgi:predicted DNA binding protein